MADKSNVYFQSNYFGVEEQALADSLTVESLQIHGIGVKYIPREEVAMDHLFGEDKLSAFNQTFDIEMYIKSFEQFGGDGDFLSKFGLEIRDELILQVSKTRWQEEVADSIAASPALPITLPARPREGDLIYFPFSKRLFEISFVEHEEVFYQLGKLFTYELRCKLFEYSSQQFDTGIPEIDRTESLVSMQTHSYNLVSGLGDYTIGEIVYQGADIECATATGEVVGWDSGTNTLIIKTLTGEFSYNEPIVGVDSGADWSFDDAGDVVAVKVDPIADNKRVEDEYEQFDIDTEQNQLTK